MRIDSRPLVALFATTLFLSSFLMFLVEPMIAKIVLPMLGGAPMVWNTCVVFFQIMLLAGYACAYAASSGLGPGPYALAYAVLLLIPTATLPLAIRTATAPPVTGNPIGWLLLVLVSSIGLPFLALSASSSVLQKLFSGTGHHAARDPYFLYAASNVGSMSWCEQISLLTVPGLITPGHRIAHGTRHPPSQFEAFSPRNGVLPPSGQVHFSAPLSVEYMTMVLSAMPNSSSLASNSPTCSS